MSEYAVGSDCKSMPRHLVRTQGELNALAIRHAVLGLLLGLSILAHREYNHEPIVVVRQPTIQWINKESLMDFGSVLCRDHGGFSGAVPTYKGGKRYRFECAWGAALEEEILLMPELRNPK